jgi:hypothetical protein
MVKSSKLMLKDTEYVQPAKVSVVLTPQLSNPVKVAKVEE